MAITARVEDGKAYLEDSGRMIAKLYVSPDERIIRLVLPELKGTLPFDVKYYNGASYPCHYVQVVRP